MAIYFQTIYGDLLAILLTFLVSIILYFKYSYTYWSKKGVPFMEPKFPLGNLKSPEFKFYVLGKDTTDFYNYFKSRGKKFGGFFIFWRPALVLTDPDYIKDVISKDFHYFIDRGTYHPDSDPLTNHLFNLDQRKWKNMRTQVTPTFTSGKMKAMCNTVVDCSNYMKGFMDAKAKLGEDIDILEVLASFTTDVIGACAFGVNCNSFKNTDAEFRSMGRTISSKRTFFGKLGLMLIVSFPELAKKLNVKWVREDVTEFFFGMVKESIKYRDENNVRRTDFLQMMIDLHKQDSTFSFGDLVAQVYVFFVAGFDTSSATMNFTLFELSKHPEIQEKARAEILEVLKKHDNKLTYEALSEIKYLEQCMDEALRMYPPGVNLIRRCTNKYTLRDTNVTIEKGTLVYIPLYGLHRDPEHFPDPDKFDPDRFSPENKKSRHGFVYLPFGEGPRNCVGLRFGKMQSKIGLITLLRDYRFSLSPNSPKDLTIDGKAFLIRSIEKLLLKAETIN